MPEEDTPQTVDERSDSRSTGYIALVIVLLLLLLMCALVATQGTKEATEKARFLARNVECLKCHTEMLPLLAKESTHNPFIKHHCTSCHNEHAGLVRVTVESEGATTSEQGLVWFRWGPFREPIWAVRSLLFGTDEKTLKVIERKAIGEASLVAEPEILCWTCHGGLGSERKMDFPHQPFAKNRCLGCHNPHASDNRPLLRTSVEALCVTCHPIGQEINRAFGHPPAVKLRCTECHAAHASDHKGILVASQRDLCFTCHPSVAPLSLLPVSHQPFEGDNCTGCHEPHGSDYEPLLKDNTPQLCYNCHTTIEGRYERASAHPIGEGMDCPSCHQPHASEHAALLVESERVLCTGCHEGIAGLASMPVQHEPFEEDPCTSCHVPHGSDYTPLLNNPQPNLCYQCHPSLAVAMSRTSHHPEECTRCHGVHAGSYDKLLFAENDNGLCYRCHPTIALTYLNSQHRGIACLSCHRPHGGRFGALRRRAPTALCTGCHPADEPHIRFVGNGDTAHRSTPQFYDANADAPLTCTSSCHSPHGSDYTYMMQGQQWYYDGTCLKCHQGVGKVH